MKIKQQIDTFASVSIQGGVTYLLFSVYVLVVCTASINIARMHALICSHGESGALYKRRRTAELVVAIACDAHKYDVVARQWREVSTSGGLLDDRSACSETLSLVCLMKCTGKVITEFGTVFVCGILRSAWDKIHERQFNFISCRHHWRDAVPTEYQEVGNVHYHTDIFISLCVGRRMLFAYI